MNQALTETVDRLRKKIKALLPEAQIYDATQRQEIYYSNDKYGNRLYGGSLLETTASALLKAMDIGEVCIPRRLSPHVTHERTGLGLELGRFLGISTNQE